jgi:hypothetical protein
MEEDTLVGILMAFMLGNSVPRGLGVDLHWCPLSHRIGTTSCTLMGVTVRRSLFNSMRREVRFGHQRRGQVEWNLNNSKDPTLRRMIKVLTKATSGSDLLSFLKDRNRGTPGDRRRNPRWDRLRLHQLKAQARGSERSEIAGQSQNGGKDPLAREETEHVTDKEAEAKLSSEEESQKVPLSSEEETEMMDESDDQLEEEGILGDPLPPPSLTEEDQEQRRRRGRTRQRTRGAGRVRETKTLLVSHTYCSHAKMQRDIKSLLHLGPSGRDEELNFSTFDKCTDSTGCGAQGGPAGTTARCEDCTVRSTVSGFSPCSTGTRLRRFKKLWLRL